MDAVHKEEKSSAAASVNRGRSDGAGRHGMRQKGLTTHSSSGRRVAVMMDVLMVGTLAVSFGLVWLLVRWCQKQVDDPE